MSMALLPTAARSFRRWPCALGFVAATLLLMGVGELYLRLAPPSDLVPYLPDGPQTGPFQDDAQYGVQYRSLAALAAEYPQSFPSYQHLFHNRQAPPTWAFFGSSVVHAPAMLAETATQYVPQRVIFHLPKAKADPLPVRFAQVEMLLAHGLKPERVFMVLIPLDISFAKHGLAQYRATSQGGLAYRPRLPPIGAELVWHSRLALKGWTRTKLHQNLPYQLGTNYETLAPDVRADMRTLFAHLAATCQHHDVPATIVLMPNDAQLLEGRSRGLQAALTEDAHAAGLDVCDVSETLLAWPDKHALLIPDRHFSGIGNRLLLAELLTHLQTKYPSCGDLPNAATVRPEAHSRTDK